MTNADHFRASETDQDTQKPFWKRRDERRSGPALTDEQLDELGALGHQLLGPHSD